MSEPNKIKQISPPRWLSRAEKRAFNVVIEARKATSNPVLATEIDAIVDYVTSRTCIGILSKLLKKELTKESMFGPNERDVMALTKAIDGTTSLSRRLARQIGLTADAIQTGE